MLKIFILGLILTPSLISCSSDIPERHQVAKKDVYAGDKDSDVKEDETETDEGQGDATPKPPRNDTVEAPVESDQPNEPTPDVGPADPRAADLALLKAWDKGKILGSSSLKVEKLNLVELK